MASGEDLDLSALKSQLSQTQETWKGDMARSQSQVDVLQEKLVEVKETLQGSEENTNKELEVLWRRVKTTGTLLMYLESKARIMVVPLLAHASCGIKRLDGVGFVDKNGIPVSSWSSNNGLFPSDSLFDEKLTGISDQHISLDGHDNAYIGELLKSMQLVADVMEILVKRVIMAESETAIEKEKGLLRQEEIRKKELQIETMSIKVEEIQGFKDDTNVLLTEMRQKVEDLVEETSRQRQRATENEEELCRVKQDFESLKSYVTSLINVRQTLMSSEMQFKRLEKLFERLMAKTEQLESENAQKEGKVQNLMQENVRLTDLLDRKEAQLLAMSEQCKLMALSGSNI